MAVSKLSRRIGGLTAAIVLGIGGMGVLATPAMADEPTGTMVVSSDGTSAQVGQDIIIHFSDITPSNATVSWEWFCGDTSRGQKWEDGLSSSYTVYPSDVGCKMHAKATITSGTDKTVLDSETVPVASVSLSTGYYSDYPMPSWSVFQGYDAASLTPGYVVVTNWGDTAVKGLSCSITEKTPYFTITAQPDATLQPQTATVVELKPVAGLKGPADKDNPYSAYGDSSSLTCKDGKGVAYTNGDAHMMVYSNPPTANVYLNNIQVGTVLDPSAVYYSGPGDVTPTHEFYFKAADGTKTSLADGYKVTKADIGKDLHATTSVTVPGFDKVTNDKDLGTVSPIGVAVSPASFAEQYYYWDESYGYKAAALDPAKVTVTFTNEGTTTVTGLTLRCDGTDFVVCGTVPDVTELAPGKSVQVTVTPKAGAKLGSNPYASVSLMNDDYTLDLYESASIYVSDSPIDWIQPQENTPAGTGTSTAAANGSSTGTGTSSTSDNHAVDTGGTVSHGSTGIALLGLGFIALGVVILKRRTA